MEDRRYDKSKLIKEVLIGISVGLVLMLVGYIAESIPDVKERVSMLSVDISWLKAVQANNTTALSNMNSKVDGIGSKVDALKITMDYHMRHSSVTQKVPRLVWEDYK
jgi:hypothetical protein